MKNFIEVTVSDTKRLININTISSVNESRRDKTEIILLPSGDKGVSRCLAAKETYDEIKTLIQEAL
mgnify:CR=1 FL=1